jgi:hypothetical protein
VDDVMAASHVFSSGLEVAAAFGRPGGGRWKRQRNDERRADGLPNSVQSNRHSAPFVERFLQDLTRAN